MSTKETKEPTKNKMEKEQPIKQKKKGAPPVGLWLRVGPDLVLEELLRDLRQIFFVINGSDYERNMHAIEIFGDESDEEFRKKAGLVAAFGRDGGLAVIYRGSPSVAAEIEADGVLLKTLDDLPIAREHFGEEGIIGLACGTSQENAAAAHDAALDFVSFGTGKSTFPPPDVLRFWTLLSDKPAVVEGPITNDYVSYWVEAEAGFLDAGDYIWAHGKGVMQGTSNMLHAIELALESQQKKH